MLRHVNLSVIPIIFSTFADNFIIIIKKYSL